MVEQPPRVCVALADSDSTTLTSELAFFRGVMRQDTEAARRRSRYQLPLVPDSAVGPVVDEAVCQRASEALAASRSYKWPTPGRVVLIRVGTTRYVAQEPIEAVIAKFDQGYRPLRLVLDDSLGLVVGFASR